MKYLTTAKIKNNRLVLVCAAVVGLLLLLSPVPAHAALSDTACDGLQQITGETCAGTGAEQVDNTLADAIHILSIVIGIVAVIMIMIAGIRYITANGDPGSIRAARDTVIYAVIGLAIAAMAQVTVRFVLS